MKYTKRPHSLSAAILSVALAASMTGCANPSPAQTTDPAETVPQTTSTTQSSMPSETQTATIPAESTEGIYTYDQSLTELRLEMEPSAAIMGVFYLGWHDGEILDDAFFDYLAEEGYLDRYPFMTQVPMTNYALTSGNEVYLIVPADPNARVEVTEWDQSVGVPTAGDVLYASETGDPFFVQGNISDIMPNLSVTVTNSYGETIRQYHPQISLRDGMLARHANPDDPVVLDFTIYADFVSIFYELYFPDASLEHLESLPMQTEDPDGEELLYLLSQHDVVPPYVFLNSFEQQGVNLYLDFNGAFTDYINELGMTGEELVLASIVNSYLSCFGADTLFLTVDGAMLETVHNSYPDSFSYLYPQE